MKKMPTEIKNPGTKRASSAERIGELIAEKMKKDKTFYLFSPDETTSNKLDKAYETGEARAWDAPKKPYDLPEQGNGRIVELLSENTLFATMVGHILGSREPAMMTSYESFFNVVTSQIIQHLKFLKQADNAKDRKSYPALNLLSTSTCWRQDHNGFSHQSPALISTLLSIPNAKVNCLFPVDDVAATATFDYMLATKNVVNLTTFNKTEEPRWIDINHAKFQFVNGGASLFGFASTDQNGNLVDADSADYIFTAAGDIPTREAIYAVNILKEDIPEIRIRFVGINALTPGAIGTYGNKLSHQNFAELFGRDENIPIVANFHGYPETLKTILGNYTNSFRVRAHGFVDEGTTTTPFEMLSLNHASRYDLALEVAKDLNRTDLIEKYQGILMANYIHANKYGDDLAELVV
ncbi:hypothetical protein IJJ18_02145 [Candidatus Saccharibacteria bacterium]|nr:hypothetical protein [Candidatus Saccharibacteria bacterium]